MKKIASLVAVASMTMASASAFAEYKTGEVNDCSQVPTHSEIQDALDAAVATNNGGLNFDMWVTVVNRFGVVCAVASASNPNSLFDDGAGKDPWLGSRVISAQKANTANLFSTDGLALSTANLFAAVQPGGSLYGLQHSNPVDTRVGYLGDPKNYGESTDPMVGLKIGGVNVFGGGLALYTADSPAKLVGAIGVSGDTSCADHNVAWKTRESVNAGAFTAANIPAGVGASPLGSDNINYSASPTGFEHVLCDGPVGDEDALSVQFTGAATDITLVP